MKNTINNNQAEINQKLDEQILVVKRDKFFQEPAWQGIRAVDFSAYLKTINENKEFLPRTLMENDPGYKQVIPYMVFNYEDRYFLMQRQAKATETRLKNKYSLGIGGHIRQEDISGLNIIDWARREFEEEVEYAGNYEVQPIGILNDDSNPVGEVHVGFVLLLKGDTPKIKVKEELKSGVLLDLKECQDFYDMMENWSQIVFNFLKTLK